MAISVLISVALLFPIVAVNGNPRPSPAPELLSIPTASTTPRPSSYDLMPDGVCDSTTYRLYSECPPGTSVFYTDTNILDSTFSLFCCTSGSRAEYNATQYYPFRCRTTSCSSSAAKDLCPTLNPRVFSNGKSPAYKQLVQDTCSTKGDSNIDGNLALCCPLGSRDYTELTMGAADMHEFPHQALMIEGCGATIIGKRHLLTAGHCVTNGTSGLPRRPEEEPIRVGINILDGDWDHFPERTYTLESITVHPRFPSLLENRNKSTPFINDIAVLRTTRDIEFGPYVKALKLAPKGFDPLKHADQGIIVGWGLIDERSEMAMLLQKSNSVFHPDSECLSPYAGGVWGAWSDYANYVVCAGGYYRGTFSPSPRNGDSGGPIIARDEQGFPVLCGLASTGGADGPGCALDITKCEPALYTEVQNYWDWIREVMGVDQDESTFYQPYLYGDEVKKGQYDHQVHITTTLGKPCGGTLIAPDTVVTAGQCVSKSDGTIMSNSDISVISGIKDLKSTSGKKHTVKGVKVLEGFARVGKPVNVAEQGVRVSITDNYYKNDLAVIKLQQPAKIDSKKVAKLASNVDIQSKDWMNEVTFLRNTSRSSGQMQRQFRLMDKDDCKGRWEQLEYLGYKTSIGDNTLCGVEKYNGGSQCDRELGGGLICKGKNGQNVLCGVQIFRLCEFALPNGFFDVSQYQDWIKNAMVSF